MARSGDTLLRIINCLKPLGKPARGATESEQHREHIHREAHCLIYDTAVEINIRIQFSRDEILILQRDALQFQRDIQERITAGFGQYVLGQGAASAKSKFLSLPYPLE